MQDGHQLAITISVIRQGVEDRVGNGSDKVTGKDMEEQCVKVTG